jgi:hypothetical protein
MMKNIMHFGALANQVYPSYLVHLLFSFGSSHLVQVTCKPNGGNTVIYVQVLCWTSCSFTDVLHFVIHLPVLPQSVGYMHGTMQMLSLVISLLQAVERAAGSEGQKITYNIIKQRLGDILYRLV